MKVIAIPTLLDAFEWDGSEAVFKKIKAAVRIHNAKDDVYMCDGQLIIYDNIFKEEETVEIGRFVVFENNKINTYSFIIFETLFQEVEE